MRTYHSNANHRRNAAAKAGLIPLGYQLIRNAEAWAADQLGSLYEPSDALAVVAALRERHALIPYRYQGQSCFLLRCSAVPDPISELLP